MEGHKKEIEHQDINDSGGESHFGSSLPETPTEFTDVPRNEQLQAEVRTVRDGTSLDEPEQRIECVDPSCSETSVADEVEDAEEKDTAVKQVKENSEKRLKKVKESSFQDLSKVDREEILHRDRNSQLKNIDVDTVSELGKVSLEVCHPSTSTKPEIENVSDSDDSLLDIGEQPSDQATDVADLATSFNNASISSQSSQPIGIPSTSRDSLGLEHDLKSPKRPTNLGSDIKQSIHTFSPKNPTSILKKFPNPFKRGHHVFLRDSPESSDYGGSPDSLEDPFLMEALCDSENQESEDFKSGSIEERRSDHTLEPVAESLDVRSPEPVTESLDAHPSEPVAEGLDVLSSEPVADGLDVLPSEPVADGLDVLPSEPVAESLGAHPETVDVHQRA